MASWWDIGGCSADTGDTMTRDEARIGASDGGYQFLNLRRFLRALASVPFLSSGLG